MLGLSFAIHQQSSPTRKFEVPRVNFLAVKTHFSSSTSLSCPSASQDIEYFFLIFTSFRTCLAMEDWLFLPTLCARVFSDFVTRCTFACLLFFTRTCPKHYKSVTLHEHLYIVCKTTKQLATGLTATTGESPEGCICCNALLAYSPQKRPATSEAVSTPRAAVDMQVGFDKLQDDTLVCRFLRLWQKHHDGTMYRQWELDRAGAGAGLVLSGSSLAHFPSF